MLTLRIDGVVCPLADERVVLPGYNADLLRRVESWRSGSCLRLKVVSTPHIDRLFSYAGDIYRSKNFNDAYHYAELEVDGVVIFNGVVVLESVERKDDGMLYRVAIRSGGAEWAEAVAQTRLNDTAISSLRIMTPSGIEESWRDEGAVRFLPLVRDSYPEEADTGLYVTQTNLMPHDYYPFLSVRAILESVAQTNGYTLNSDFIASDLFSRLMISGAYRSVESTAAYASMGFRALRSTSTTAQAGEDGRVYAWEPKFASNIGALVDTVNPTTVDETGVVLSDAFSAGGCFSFTDGRPCFKPKREISAAFDIHLKYKTEFKVVSSARLQGFDKIHLGNGCDLSVALQNRYVDQRNDVRGGLLYRLFIFDYDATASYELRGAGVVSGSSTLVSFPAGFSGETALLCKASGSGSYEPYDGDWALYDGYVSGVGEQEVELTVRTPFEVLTPTSPKNFNDIYFGGAEEGQQMTLMAGCSIVPIFSGAAGYGEEVDFSDVANLDISQAKLIDAIVHMFNLRIYTHEDTKQIFIEPYDDFFASELYDWQWRQLDDETTYREGVVECSELTTLGYLAPDGVTARSTPSGEVMGCWTKHRASYAAKQGRDTRLNPLFHPTISLDEVIGSARSAEVLTVGDRDRVDQEDNIEPRVVLYYGVSPLSDGENWPSTVDVEGYPKAAFHSASESYTLCFEDRDGCEGLHRFYDRELEECSERGLLRTNVYLPPADYVALFHPDHNGATIRSRFRLSVNNHSSQYRLQAIESYDPEHYVATCIFQRLLND